MATGQESPQSGQTPKPRVPHWAMVALFALFTAWTLWPALSPVHIEGFSAELQSMAILLNRHGSHGLAYADQAYPISTEFLYLTRSGLIILLQVFMRIFGESGDLGFRLLMMVSMATFVASAFSIARRWSQDSAPILFLALLITPGLVEIGFYFSDNLPSAALALLAMAIVPKEGVSPRKAFGVWAVIGALFAAAILVRSDAVLLAPGLIACLFLNKPKALETTSRVAGGAFGFGILFGLACTVTPFHLSEALPIIKLFGKMQSVGLGPDRLRDVRMAFFGMLTPFLLVIGIIVNWRRSGWAWRLGVIVLPVLFYAAVLPRAYEPRYYLLLGAPALLIHGAAGLRWVLDQWKPSSKSLVATIVRPVSLSLALFIALGPLDINLLDGPRTAYGRLWTTFVWRDWQHGVNSGLDKLDHVALAVAPGEKVLAISTQFNADDYFRVRMLGDGFDILPEDQAQREFPVASEVYRRGDRTVVHIRTPDPYFYLGNLYGQPNFYSTDIQVMWSLTSLKTIPFTRAVLLNWGAVNPIFDPAFHLVGKARPEWRLEFPKESFIPKKAPIYDGDVFIQPVNFDQVEQIRLRAEKEVMIARKRARGWTPITSYQDFHEKFGWRFGPAP